MDYKSIAYQAIVKQPGYTNENVEDMLDTQSIIDWITEQDILGNYPNFGDEMVIDGIKALSDNPNMNGINSNVSPTLAKYSISIQIDYVDYTHVSWVH